MPKFNSDPKINKLKLYNWFETARTIKFESI